VGTRSVRGRVSGIVLPPGRAGPAVGDGPAPAGGGDLHRLGRLDPGRPVLCPCQAAPGGESGWGDYRRGLPPDPPPDRARVPGRRPGEHAHADVPEPHEEHPDGFRQLFPERQDRRAVRRVALPASARPRAGGPHRDAGVLHPSEGRQDRFLPPGPQPREECQGAHPDPQCEHIEHGTQLAFRGLTNGGAAQRKSDGPRGGQEHAPPPAPFLQRHHPATAEHRAGPGRGGLGLRSRHLRSVGHQRALRPRDPGAAGGRRGP